MGHPGSPPRTEVFVSRRDVRLTDPTAVTGEVGAVRRVREHDPRTFAARIITVSNQLATEW
ncbi:hypothetical protein GCM10010517_75640 [Streptosporangium fragile]|uniref:Uncharacterized protein n=1 Tax=Streptosporangium fragile TaxID=46186 RepID=A0ABN3WCJ9_9ACTN